MARVNFPLWFAALAVVATGCGNSSNDVPDARRVSVDAARDVDAPSIDAHPTDAPLLDAHPTDAPLLDAHLTDAAPSHIDSASAVDAAHAIDATAVADATPTVDAGLGRPTLISIDPTTGDVAGGTSVDVVGTNFSADTAVFFADVAATDVTVNSTTDLTVIAPPADAVGAAFITVTTDGGSTPFDESFQYEYTDFPAVDSVTPNLGSVNGGTQVTISGVNFNSVTDVTFGGVSADSFTIVDDATITATAPAQSDVSIPDTVDVEVINDDGTSPDVDTDQFTYGDVPVVTSLSPNVVDARQVTLITVQGSGFTGATAVFVGTTSVSFNVENDTSLTLNTPAANDSSLDVTVENDFDTSATSPADIIQFVN